MTDQKVARVQYGDSELAYLFEVGTGKFNDRIKFTEEDVRMKTKVYCKEQYAQEYFDKYRRRAAAAGAVSKDISVGEQVDVTAVTYNLEKGTVTCEGVGSGVPVIVPMQEFIYDVLAITSQDVFSVLITKADNGAYVGTCKNPAKYREEIIEANKNNRWFDVKIVGLIRGGYRALYKGTVECFIPGSHAAANVIGDFDSLIGQTMPVMVDNFDWSSRMYVVSYKKYVRYSMVERINDLKFGHKYTGKLTSNPTEYGIFVEFENYYTGLIHRMDFANYEEACSKYKAGDVVEVYVKNVTEKNGNYRIVLTLNENDIDQAKLIWYNVKVACENKKLPFKYDNDNGTIIVSVDKEDASKVISIAIPYDFDTTTIGEYDTIFISKVDVLRREIKFDFYK